MNRKIKSSKNKIKLFIQHRTQHKMDTSKYLSGIEYRKKGWVILIFCGNMNQAL